MRIDRILIATRNPAKKARFSRLLSEVADRILGLDEIELTEKPIESGETAEENAEIKSKFYSPKTGLLTLSEDESLFVDFLPEKDQPGVHVRRINKRDEVDDDKLLAYWEALVAKVPHAKRTGYWHIAYSLATPAGIVHTVSLNHPIIFFSPSSKLRLPGWPMSSLQGPVFFGKPDSELTERERRIKDKRADKLIKEKLKVLM